MTSLSSIDVKVSTTGGDGIRSYYEAKINDLEVIVGKKERNLVRLEAQRNELNSKVRGLREELQLLHMSGSYIGEVIKVMSRKKVLVKVGPEGKYVVDIAKDIDIEKCTMNTRVALKDGSYQLHRILPTKVDPLVSLMKLEKVPVDC